jgi:hypothetical protein
VFFTELAKGRLEPRAVFLEYPAIKLRVGLLNQIIQSITVDKGILDGGVRMKVEIEFNRSGRG